MVHWSSVPVFLHFTHAVLSTASKTSEEVLVAQSCLALCDPVDCRPSVSSVRGILQGRILEWLAIPSPGHLPNPGTETRSPTSQANSLLCEPPGKPFLCVTSFTLVVTSEIDSVISEAVPHPTPAPASKAVETYLVPAHYGLLLSNPVFPTGFPLWGSLTCIA